MGSYTSNNALHEKFIWQANGRLSVENFDKENVDKLIKICQISQYFPHQKFAPYSIVTISNVLSDDIKCMMIIDNLC